MFPSDRTLPDKLYNKEPSVNLILNLDIMKSPAALEMAGELLEGMTDEQRPHDTARIGTGRTCDLLRS